MISLSRWPAWRPWTVIGLGGAILIALAGVSWSSTNDTEEPRKVIRSQDRDRAFAASQAREEAVQQRAFDAVVRLAAERRGVEDEIPAEKIPENCVERPVNKPEKQVAKLPATTVALNCQRVREAYTEEELAEMQAFRELCE